MSFGTAAGSRWVDDRVEMAQMTALDRDERIEAAEKRESACKIRLSAQSQHLSGGNVYALKH